MTVTTSTDTRHKLTSVLASKPRYLDLGIVAGSETSLVICLLCTITCFRSLVVLNKVKPIGTTCMCSGAFSTSSVGRLRGLERYVLGIHVGAEPMGSTLEAAGRLQLGVFASGPLQEASLLQHAALEVSTISTRTMQPVIDCLVAVNLTAGVSVQGWCSLCCA